MGIERNEAIQIQNNLFCNGIITLGKEYNFEQNVGKRVACITKQIKNGMWKVLKKPKDIDNEVYEKWIELTKKYNDKKREMDKDNSDNNSDNNVNQNRKRKRDDDGNNSQLKKKTKTNGITNTQ